MTVAISKARRGGLAGGHLRLHRQHVGLGRRLRRARRHARLRHGAEGTIALGKLSQAVIHGAKVLVVDGNFDQALDDRPADRREATRSRS